jgi:hypothetical protein
MNARAKSWPVAKLSTILVCECVVELFFHWDFGYKLITPPPFYGALRSYIIATTCPDFRLGQNMALQA